MGVTGNGERPRMRRAPRRARRRSAWGTAVAVLAAVATCLAVALGVGLAAGSSDSDGASGQTGSGALTVLTDAVSGALGTGGQVGADATDDADYVLEHAGALALSTVSAAASADGDDEGDEDGGGGTSETLVTEDGEPAAEPVDYLALTYTFADGTLLDEKTIDELWDDSGDHEGAYLAQFTSYAVLYNLDDASDYYVARVNGDVSSFEVTDWAATENNDYAVLRDDVVYDAEAGLVYVPKGYLKTASSYEGDDYETDGYEDYLVTGSTRLQLLFCSTGGLEEALGATVAFDFSLTSTGVSGVASDGTLTASVFDTAVYVDLTDGSALSADAVASVTVNGVPYDADSGVWDLDEETGQLAVAFYPAAVRSLEVVLDGTASAASVAAAAVRLLTGAAVAEAATAESSTWTDSTKWSSKIPKAGDVGIEFSSTPVAGTLFEVSGYTKYCTNYKDYLSDDNYILGAVPEFGSNQHSDSLWTGNLIDLVTDWSTYHNKSAYYVDYATVHKPTESTINAPYLRAKLSTGTYASTDGASNTLTISDSSIYLLLSCSHNTDAVDDETESTATALLRILAVDEGRQQIIVGVATHSVYTQSGAGIFRLSYDETSGALSISKKVKTGSANLAKVAFTFSLVIEDDGEPVTGSYAATLETYAETVFDSSDDPETTETTTVTFNSSGKAWIELYAGQKLIIEGLPAGADYTLREPKSYWPDGYTCSSDAGYEREGTVVKLKTTSEVFYNAYSASGTWSPSVQKYLNGSTSMSGYTFTFKLTETTSGASYSETKKNDSSGVVSFSDIEYDEGDVGTHTYTIAETGYSSIPASVDDSCLVLDGSTVTVTVKVSDNNDGTLKVTATYSGGSSTSSKARFYNEVSGSVEISKTLVTGGSGSSDATFSFTITVVDADGDAVSGSYPCTLYREGVGTSSGTITLSGKGKATFTLKDGWTRTISELPAGATATVVETSIPDGYWCSNAKGTATASATKTATVPAGDTAEVAYYNSYSASGSWTPHAQKYVNGRSSAAAFGSSTFTIGLYDSSGALIEKKTASSSNKGAVTFSSVSVDLDDVGELTYTIKEIAGSDSSIAYDATVYTVTVTVVDNGDGTLSTVVDYGDGATIAAFYNTSVQSLTFSKTVSGATAATQASGYTFGFTVTLLSEKGGSALSGAYTTTIYDASGTKVGSSFTIESGDTVELADGQSAVVEGLPWGSYYEVAEQVSGLASCYSSAGAESAAGTLKEDASLTFKNRYRSTGTLSLYAYKELSGLAIEEGMFSFTLACDGTTVRTAENGAATSTTEAADGGVTSTATAQFAALSYTEADDGQTYTYTVSELDLGLANFTYDGSVYTVKVYVEDDGEGHMTATPTFYDEDGEEIGAEEVVFENDFSATATWTPTAMKLLSSGSLSDYLDEPGFSFTLTETTAGASYSETVWLTDSSGTVSFSAITFDQYDAGTTFTYQIVEDDTGDERIDYAANTVTVAVTPYLTADYRLTYTCTVENSDGDYENAAVFVNDLEPGSLLIAKLVTDEDELDGDEEFVFYVRIWGESVDDELLEQLEEQGFTRGTLADALWSE